MASSGLTEIKVKQVTAKALAQRGKISKEDIKDILEEKKQVTWSEILEFFESKSSQDDIGGLNILKFGLIKDIELFLKKLGIMDYLSQKSLTRWCEYWKITYCKSNLRSWSMPLLRLDVGRLFSSLVVCEARTRETISGAEAMSPCILWIDEIDKGFGGDARSDGEQVKEFWRVC